jgi:hypothetical protein
LKERKKNYRTADSRNTWEDEIAITIIDNKVKLKGSKKKVISWCSPNGFYLSLMYTSLKGYLA